MAFNPNKPSSGNVDPVVDQANEQLREILTDELNPPKFRTYKQRGSSYRGGAGGGSGASARITRRQAVIDMRASLLDKKFGVPGSKANIVIGVKDQFGKRQRFAYDGELLALLPQPDPQTKEFPTQASDGTPLRVVWQKKELSEIVIGGRLGNQNSTKEPFMVDYVLLGNDVMQATGVTNFGQGTAWTRVEESSVPYPFDAVDTIMAAARADAGLPPTYQPPEVEVTGGGAAALGLG